MSVRVNWDYIAVTDRKSEIFHWECYMDFNVIPC